MELKYYHYYANTEYTVRGQQVYTAVCGYYMIKRVHNGTEPRIARGSRDMPERIRRYLELCPRCKKRDDRGIQTTG